MIFSFLTRSGFLCPLFVYVLRVCQSEKIKGSRGGFDTMKSKIKLNPLVAE
jgi:hypothetical protein